MQCEAREPDQQKAYWGKTASVAVDVALITNAMTKRASRDALVRGLRSASGLAAPCPAPGRRVPVEQYRAQATNTT
jgi:hypothetical protein